MAPSGAKFGAVCPFVAPGSSCTRCSCRRASAAMSVSSSACPFDAGRRVPALPPPAPPPPLP
eukprot:2897493-Lingulodinium_polyedra.AAC.1